MICFRKVRKPYPLLLWREQEIKIMPEPFENTKSFMHNIQNYSYNNNII